MPLGTDPKVKMLLYGRAEYMSATLPIQRLYVFSCGQMVAWVYGRVKLVLQRGEIHFSPICKRVFMLLL